MALPNSGDYIDAIQNLRATMGDEELRAGEAACNQLGIPLLFSGNFASVFKIVCAQTSRVWAVKCFTREVSGLQERYRLISDHLKRARLPFMVEFEYLERGILVHGQWWPILKMRWVEGLSLNSFVFDNLGRPAMLKQLLGLWTKVAQRLRAERIAHADLQHGNVILVPLDSGQLQLKLIDYDGMHIPALRHGHSGELGHDAYQHPARFKQNIYSAEVDRFSHLVIYTAIQSVLVGGKDLWDRYNNKDNLLFQQEDFVRPGDSALFGELWGLSEPNTHAAVGWLILATQRRLEEVPLIEELVKGDQVRPLTSAEEKEAVKILNGSLRATGKNPMAAKIAEIKPRGRTVTKHPVDLPAEQDLTKPLVEVLPSPQEYVPPLPRGIEVVDAEVVPPGAHILALNAIKGAFGKADRLLLSLVGEDNELLHKFVRLLLIGMLVTGISYLVLRRRDPAASMAQAVSFSTSGHAGEEQVFSNLNMKFCWCPAGEFEMGEDEELVTTKIPHGFWIGKYEVTQSQWMQLIGTNPWEGQKNVYSSDDSPASFVSRDDAMTFCRKLTEQERTAGRLPADIEYTLPSEEQWEYAARAGTTSKFHFGEPEDELDQYAWYEVNTWPLDEDYAHPVGMKRANPWGLHDCHGNVWEWTRSDFDAKQPAIENDSSVDHGLATIRGGSWSDSLYLSYSGSRAGRNPIHKSHNIGFRLIIQTISSSTHILDPGPNNSSGNQDIASSTIPVDDKTAGTRAGEERSFTDLPIEFCWCPPGKFMMGSSPSDRNASQDEKPSIPVEFSEGFWLGKYEITQAAYEKVVGNAPWSEKRQYVVEGDRYPATWLGWYDAVKFCQQLNVRERLAKRIPVGWAYDLPTEEEWEYGCRAGTTADFSYGDAVGIFGSYAWFHGNTWSTNEKYAHQVGLKDPNRWGLYDMHGNVSEWCQNLYVERREATGTSSSTSRVHRGGNWILNPDQCRSAKRSRSSPNETSSFIGMRIVLRPHSIRRKIGIPPDLVRSGETKPTKFPSSQSSVERDLSSLNMKFCWCPAGNFQMGEGVKQVSVTLSKAFWIGKYEVTQREWEQVMGTTPWDTVTDVRQGPSYPAVSISYNDAREFCRKLTDRERLAGRISPREEYTLPTEAQWEYACRAGTSSKYCFGSNTSDLEDYAWYDRNAFFAEEKYPHQVGTKKPNAWGIHDMHGNVWESCLDNYYYKFSGGRDPIAKPGSPYNVRRGGSWYESAASADSTSRTSIDPASKFGIVGFRVAMIPENQSAQSSAVNVTTPIKQASKVPPPGVLPAGKIGEVKVLSSLQLKFAWCPAGGFQMGEGNNQVSVTLTQPFWIGVHEVTQGDWERVMKTSPWRGNRDIKDGPAYPATFVSHTDCMKFCDTLTDMDRRSGLLNPQEKYTLPTEAQWEYAARAGTTTKYSFGDDESKLDDYAWFDANAYFAKEKYAHEVGMKKPNPWNLYDIHGNVWEWCLDGYDNSKLTGGMDPFFSGSSHHVCRGGSWNATAGGNRSALRSWYVSTNQASHLGFRMVRVSTSSTNNGSSTSAVSLPGQTTGPVTLAEVSGTQSEQEREFSQEKIKFCWCQPDIFRMGDDADKAVVRLSEGFWIGKYEVTQRQWEQVMHTTPWKGQIISVREGDNYPASYISWNDAQTFCQKLTDAERSAGRLAARDAYSLPTEAQWEYACRATSQAAFSFGNDEADLSSYAWYAKSTTTESYAHEVGLKHPNAWGLHDMHGNLWEWCQDAYSAKPKGGLDPVFYGTGDKVRRGGAWNSPAPSLHSQSRLRYQSDRRAFYLGFRLVLSAKSQ